MSQVRPNGVTGITTDVSPGSRVPDDIRRGWNSIFDELPPGSGTADVTSTYEWYQSIIDAGFAPDDVRLITFRQDSHLRGIMPVFVGKLKSMPLVRVVSPVTELYSGRADVLFSPPQDEVLAALFETLRGQLSDWDVFMFSILDRPDVVQTLEKCAAIHGLHLIRFNTSRSPVVTLRASWDDQLASLPKKFRWTIRNGEKLLREAGELHYEHITSASRLDYFVDAMLAIEARSWKEDAATSVTKQKSQQQFYNRLLPRAAEAGWFSGHLLCLDGQPIAHIFGLLFREVFYDLKESYDQEFQRLSPGHVLKRFAFPELQSLGAAEYDFMGECEPYKMKWTSDTYTKATFTLTNSTVRGRFVYLRDLCRRLVRGSDATGESA